ncbi:unnamed protein product [Candida parapsilosis]
MQNFYGILSPLSLSPLPNSCFFYFLDSDLALPSNPALFFLLFCPFLFLLTTPKFFLFCPLPSLRAFRFSSLLFASAATVSLTTCCRSFHSISLLNFFFSFLFNAFFNNFSSSFNLTPSACDITLSHLSFSFCFACSSSGMFSNFLFFFSNFNK